MPKQKLLQLLQEITEERIPFNFDSVQTAQSILRPKLRTP